MLENSFVHLPGIGPETEERLWSSGLLTWDDLESNIKEIFSERKASKILDALEGSRQAHQSNEYHYFQERLKSPEMWRLVPSVLKQNLSRKIAYLDIETTGLGFPPQSHSTSIAVLFDGQLHLEYELDKKYKLLREIENEALLLVTFNGGPFDLPFLRREFGLSFAQAHLDLRFWFARLNHRGGLKRIQSSFPQIPQRDFMDIDGFDAVRLWSMHLNGIPNALDTLLTYNAEDTVVLEQLLFCGLNIEAERRPSLNLPIHTLPVAPKIPTQVCPHVYQLLRG